MGALARRHRELVGECAALRAGLAERDRRVQELSDELFELNQRRRDAGKRLDDLIAQLDALEVHIGRPARRR